MENQFLKDKSYSFPVASPSDNDLFHLGKLPYDATVKEIHCIVDPADAKLEDIDIQIQECDATGDNCGATESLTCVSTGTVDDGIDDAVWDVDDWIALDIGEASTSNEIDVLTVSIYYQVTRK